jgi:hypothetical protein
MQKEESFTSVFDQVLEDKKREKKPVVQKPQQIEDIIDSDSDDEDKDFLVDEEEDSETRQEEPIPSVDPVDDAERLIVTELEENPIEVKQESKMALLCKYLFSFSK